MAVMNLISELKPFKSMWKVNLIMVIYKLHLVVLDNTANCKFLLFDNLALQLLNTPCIELTGPITDEIQDPNVLPSILKDLGEKHFCARLVLRGRILFISMTLSRFSRSSQTLQ
ncbi:hypothetical protein Bca4012_084406 [Brassica carinata]